MSDLAKNGKPRTREWIVTYRYDCYETVKATDPEHASKKALDLLRKVPGRRTVEIIRVEEL